MSSIASHVDAVSRLVLLLRLSCSSLSRGGRTPGFVAQRPLAQELERRRIQEHLYGGNAQQRTREADRQLAQDRSALRQGCSGSGQGFVVQGGTDGGRAGEGEEPTAEAHGAGGGVLRVASSSPYSSSLPAQGGVLRVAYSLHSSFEELSRFLAFLAPSAVRSRWHC